MDNKYILAAEDAMDFLSKAHSTFHAVENLSSMLDKHGFLRLNEKERFNLERGKSYYITRNSSALIAFKIPESFDGVNIAAAHTDSPCFRIKENPDVKTQNGPTRLNVEGYGGMLMAPWFDRPLSIAGRVFIKGEEVDERLVDFGPGAVEIVNLAIHQNRDANKGYSYSVQNDLLPIFSDSDADKDFMDVLADKAGCNKEDILSYDLYLYNDTKPQIWGVDGAFFSSSRIDDLECAYTSIKALLESDARSKIAMCALFDNEEVGSGTKQGALSDFLYNTLIRIFSSLGLGEEERMMLLASSRMLSADNAHAVHPAHTQKSDITNKPRMNGGVVIKYSANQKYTTDGESGAYVIKLLQDSNIPYQLFFNNSDVPGGSTLGNLSTYKVSIPTCDIGAAELAMHSPYETAGTKDVLAMIETFKAFFSV